MEEEYNKPELDDPLKQKKNEEARLKYKKLRLELLAQ